MIRRLLMSVAFLATLSGCGYQEYMDRFQDTLAENDYSEKVENALGPRVSDSQRGFSVRWPANVVPDPKAMSSTDEDELIFVEADEEDDAVVHYATFESAEGSSEAPIRAAVFVSRSSPKHKSYLEWDRLAAYALEPGIRETWMGEGSLAVDELKPEPRDIPAGPNFRTRSQPRISVRWATVNQASSGEDEQEDYLWILAFIEQEEGSAIFAYRVARSDYTRAFGAAGDDGTVSTVSEAVDMSVTTAQIEAAPGAAVPEGEGRRGRRT